jgi:outer membrane protein assembly factor BamB
MGQGNGISVSPDGTRLYATASDGTIGAMDPSDGSVVWTYKPTTGSTLLGGNGQASISEDGSYLAYGVTEDLDLPDESCKIVALSLPSGDVKWISPALTGACQGTPHVSSSGEYVFVTHNSAFSTVGHFSVLRDDQDGAVLYETTDANGPFSPPGFYRMPIEGNYNAGRDNNQDILVWGYADEPDATTGEQGSVFAFQLPFNYIGDLDVRPLEVTTLVATTGWRSSAPPLLTAGGQQLFWPVSRSQFRSWVGTRFSASASGSASFERGIPSFLAPQTTPAVDNSTTPTIVCSGTAGLEFVCMNAADINTGAIWSMTLAGLVLSNPIFSTEGDRVYFAEDRGVIFSVDPQTGDKYFEKSAGAPLDSNFALSNDGAFLYFGDHLGTVVAWKVAEEAIPPTSASVAEPTMAPTVEESMAPSAVDQDTAVPTPLSTTATAPTAPRADEPTTSPPPPPTPVTPTDAPPTPTPATSGVTSFAVTSTMPVGAIAALCLL